MDTAKPKPSFWFFLATVGVVIVGVTCFLAPPLAPAGAERIVLWDDGSGSNWNVYVMENGTRRPLTNEHDGSFSGCAYSGQTFFATCVLKNEFENALLEVNGAHGVVIFLDQDLLYASAPISSTDLDTLEVEPRFIFRTSADRMSLPSGYAGRRLTIAQAQIWDGPVGAEESTDVYLAPIILYGAETYRTENSSEVARSLYPAIALAVIGMLLLVTLAISAWFHATDRALAFLTGFVFLWMADICLRSSPLEPYYGSLEFLESAFYCGSLTCLFLFMGAHMTRFRRLVVVAAVAQGTVVVICTLMPAEGNACMGCKDMPIWSTLAVLCLCIVCSFLEARRSGGFYRLFARSFWWLWPSSQCSWLWRRLEPNTPTRFRRP